MNQLYTSAVNAILAGTLDLLTDPLMVAGYWSVYFYPEHEFRNQIYGTPLATPPVPLGGRVVFNRTLHADPVTLAAVGEDEALQKLIIYRGDTDALVAYIDQRPDLAPLNVVGNGGPVIVTWAGVDGRQVISL